MPDNPLSPADLAAIRADLATLDAIPLNKAWSRARYDAREAAAARLEDHCNALLAEVSRLSSELESARRDERERVARAIEAEADRLRGLRDDDELYGGLLDGLSESARIARRVPPG